MQPRSFIACSLAVLVSAFLAACGDSDSKSTNTGATNAGGSSAARVAPPEEVTGKGLVFCSDMTFPPFEFQEGGEPRGADIELGQAVAELMGLEAQFDQTGFDGIVAAIQSRKCDLMVNGVYETPERREVLSFTSYARVGQAVLVRKGNPDGIADVMDLSGKSVAVQVGTANRDYIVDTLNAQLSAADKPDVKVVAFPQNTDAINALRTDRVDAYFAGTPEIAYLSKQEGGAFEQAGDQVKAEDIGIAVRKDDTELQAAVQQAVDILYREGRAQQILEKWDLGSAVLRQ